MANFTQDSAVNISDDMEAFTEEPNTSFTDNDVSLEYTFEVIAYFFFTLNILVACAIIANNSVVMASFMKFEFVRTVENYFLLSLSVSDLMTGPFFITANIINTFFGDSIEVEILCVLSGGILALVFLCQIWSILLVTIDRWMCVHYPMLAPRPLSDRVAKILIAVVWFAASVLAVPMMIFNTWAPGRRCYSFRVLNEIALSYLAIPLAILPLVVMPILYSMLWRTAMKHARQISDQAHALADPVLSMRGQQLKTMRTLSMILGLLYLSWLPTILMFFGLHIKITSNTVAVVIKVCRELSITFLFLGSVLNPVVFHRSCPQFRKGLEMILFPKRAREYYRNKALQDIMPEDPHVLSKNVVPQPEAVIAENVEMDDSDSGSATQEPVEINTDPIAVTSKVDNVGTFSNTNGKSDDPSMGHDNHVMVLQNEDD